MSEKNAQSQNIEETLARLETDLDRGLSSSEAKSRQQKYGPNKIEAREKTWWQRLLSRFWGRNRRHSLRFGATLGGFRDHRDHAAGQRLRGLLPGVQGAECH